MATEISGNLSDYVIRKQNYSGYAAQGMAGSGAAGGTKKQETEKVQETENAQVTAGSNKPKSTAEYANELAKLVPSVEFKVGNSFSTAKTGITLTVNPQLLEKMQNDPEQEKEMKELIKGVESAINMLDSVNRASGWTVVYKHCYIDENGQFRSIAYLRNDFMLKMSDKLREERRKNSEKLTEKTKEKAAEKREELEEILEGEAEAGYTEAANAEEANTEEENAEARNIEAANVEEANAEEKIAEKALEGSAYDKVEQLLKEKMSASKDGTIYLNDTDIRIIIEAAQEENAGKITVKEQPQIGANLDLKI